jgi:hypothetical protein
MAVTHCRLCEKNSNDAASFGTNGFAEGMICPICQRSTCRYHLTTVRWKWRTPAHDLDSAQICRECAKSYRHRSWDSGNREWVS